MLFTILYPISGRIPDIERPDTGYRKAGYLMYPDAFDDIVMTDHVTLVFFGAQFLVTNYNFFISKTSSFVNSNNFFRK